MFLLSVLRNALFVLLPLCFFVTTYLYTYPFFYTSCAFPLPEQDAKTAHDNTWYEHFDTTSEYLQKPAPFRLLALGDPQLEGDSSIPDTGAVNFPNWSKFWKDALLLKETKHTPLQRVRHSLHDLIDFYLDDIPKAFEVYRKRLDHIGNDYYLGHIYRTLHWWSMPTHVTVLGDLVGSQWIDNGEFERRGARYWNRVFKRGLKVPDELANEPSEDFKNTLLGEDADLWKRRILNVAGNHDIGYAGDLSQSRIDRFTKVFGKPNYELRFNLPWNNTDLKIVNGEDEDQERPIPELRIVVINDMNLDAPAGSSDLQAATYSFLNNVISHSKEVDRPAHFTLVLTHIPLHKEAGVCVDPPFFDYYSGEFSDGIKEQNHLSRGASEGFLQGIFGMSGNPNADGQGFGRNGVILTGHDHEGCDIYHYINQTTEEGVAPKWRAKPWQEAVDSNITVAEGVPGLREITVRSMMGDYAGNAGLLSLWFDEETWDWRFEFSNCQLGKQHLWWFVHIVDFITLIIAVVYAILTISINLYNVIVRKFGFQRAGNGASDASSKKDDGSSTALDHQDVDVLKASGFLSVPDSGKKSLRKKRSKQKLKSNDDTASSAS